MASNQKSHFTAWVLVSLLALSATSGAYAEGFRVGLVLDKGGKDDKSFNSAAYAGLGEAEKQLHVVGKTVEATDDNAFEPMLRSLAQKKYDLIIAIGVSQGEAVKKVSGQFPDSKFAVVDCEVKAPNVRSLLFEEQEGAYLMGAIAELKSKTGKIGFVGGMDIPLIRRFQLAYEAGAKKINPKAEVFVNYIGVTGEAWNNPPKGKELALSQFEKGADVIFQAAGASGMGVFDATEEKKKLAIGVDSNQNWIKPGFILTSMLKRVDKAVYLVIEDTLKSKFTSGIIRHNLKDQGIDVAVDAHNKTLMDAGTLAKVAELKAQIISGKIHVPDYYQSKK